MVDGSQIVLWNTQQLSTSFDHWLAHLLWARCLDGWWRCVCIGFTRLLWTSWSSGGTWICWFCQPWKKLKKTIECLSPPFLGTGSNNCNWAAIAPVEKRLINIVDQIMIIVVYDMLLCEDDFKANLLKDRPPPPLAIVCWTSRELPCKHSSLKP